MDYSQVKDLLERLAINRDCLQGRMTDSHHVAAHRLSLEASTMICALWNNYTEARSVGHYEGHWRDK